MFMKFHEIDVFMKFRCVTRPSLRRGYLWKSSSVRSENRRMSLQLFTESEICSHRKMRASGVRDHGNFAPNSCERIAKFSEFRRDFDTKMRAFAQRALRKLRIVAAALQ